MSNMHIPGFTAEASLYTTEERYRQAYFSTSVTDSGIVLPQFSVCHTEGVDTLCFSCDCPPWSEFCSCHRHAGGYTLK